MCTHLLPVPCLQPLEGLSHLLRAQLGHLLPHLGKRGRHGSCQTISDHLGSCYTVSDYLRSQIMSDHVRYKIISFPLPTFCSMAWSTIPSTSCVSAFRSSDTSSGGNPKNCRIKIKMCTKKTKQKSDRGLAVVFSHL